MSERCFNELRKEGVKGLGQVRFSDVLGLRTQVASRGSGH